MIKIDKNIPPPVSGTTINSAISRLQVGESFLLEAVTPSIKNTLHLKIRKNSTDNKTFMTRTQDEDIRVWRLT